MLIAMDVLESSVQINAPSCALPPLILESLYIWDINLLRDLKRR